MATIKAFQLDGYELYFNYGDHDPPHFHLSQKGESWNIRVQFLECTDTHLAWTPNRPMPRIKKKELLEKISEHRQALIDEHATSQGT